MKIICVGLNYTDHIAELPRLIKEAPKEPVLFTKPDTAILLKRQPFFIPEFTNEIHHEIELIVRINRTGKHIAKQFAHKYYDQISLGIDFTARDLQYDLKQKGHPWEKAKAFDGSAVIGTWQDKNKYPDLNNLNFHLTKNQDVVQKANTNQMIHQVDELISYISKYFTLKIGDIIFTGTPKGVAKVATNDQLVGYLEDEALFSIKVK